MNVTRLYVIKDLGDKVKQDTSMEEESMGLTFGIVDEQGNERTVSYEEYMALKYPPEKQKTITVIIRDGRGHKKVVKGENFIYLVDFTTAYVTLYRKWASEDNATFTVERVEDHATLTVETGTGIIGRRRGDEAPQYTRTDARDSASVIRGNFACDGYDALDSLDPERWGIHWVADRESILPDDSYVNHELEIAEGHREAAERRRQIRAMPKLDRRALTKFCQMWDQYGHNEYDGKELAYHVIFDGGAGESEAAEREELLRIIDTLGLEVADTPSNAPEGSVWVCGDPRVDLELEKWS